jgi:hypothetical protein
MRRRIMRKRRIDSAPDAVMIEPLPLSGHGFNHNDNSK